MPNTHRRRRRRRDSTMELSRVGGVNATVGSRDPVDNFLCCWAIEIGDKWGHNDVIVEKVINMDRYSRGQTAMEYGVWSVSKLSTESVDSRRELVANFVHTADADATQLNGRVASASAVCVGHYLAWFWEGTYRYNPVATLLVRWPADAWGGFMHRRRSSDNFGGGTFLPEIYVWKIKQNARILHDDCPKNIFPEF